MYSKQNQVNEIEVETINPHQWTEKYADYLYSYAVCSIADEEQAKDLVQETFLAALEKIEKFEYRSSEKTWLTSILKNKIFDIYRTRASGLKKVLFSESYPEFFNQTDGHWKDECKPKEFSVKDDDAIENKEFSHICSYASKNCLPYGWLLLR